MVEQDEQGKVKNVSGEIWEKYQRDFRVSEGGLEFANLYHKKPNTLFGPTMTWDEFTDPSQLNKEMCTLKFVMNDCPMEYILINEKKLCVKKKL